MKISRKGFTLAELLIVVAIIAVLVAVAIPVFGNQLEKSREAADLANVRAAYAEVLTEANMGIYDKVVTVDLKQKQYDWQSADVITIGGISHSVKEGDTYNWRGKPGAGGHCEISFDQENGTKFVWSGDGTSASNSYNMREDFFATLESSGCLNEPQIKNNSNFEIDSKAAGFSTFVPKIEAVLGEQSLLKNGTWAFLGDGRAEKKSERYLFWTSFDIDKVGVGKQIPILIQTGDEKYYVSNSTTAARIGKNNKVTHVAISDHLDKEGYKKVIMAGGGQVYSSLSEAYAAYEKELEKKEYKDLLK